LRKQDLTVATPALSIASTTAKNRQGHQGLKILQTKSETKMNVQS
jgi:hypothetical protein